MKGLEFPVVFVVDVVNQRFPMNRSSYNGWLPSGVIQDALNRGLYQTGNAGEARLFYTALTRAERFLYVTGSKIHPGLKTAKKPSSYKLRLCHQEICTDCNSLPTGTEKVAERRRIDDNSMPTSFTEIKDYLECPMKYKYRKLFGFSPAVPELFGFGLTTHTAINKLHQSFPLQVPTSNEVENTIDDVFHLKHVFPSNDPARPGPFERAKDVTKKVVSNYVTDYSSDFTQSRQVERKFEIRAGRALITGSIDLLLKEDLNGNVIAAKVIDFKSMDHPENPDELYWINLALQVQLYAHASRVVLNEDTQSGAVHLLKAKNLLDLPNRINIPVDDDAVNAAIQNIQWAVARILEYDFPMRPSTKKCSDCDFNMLCSKQLQAFSNTLIPVPIHIPLTNGTSEVNVKAFSDIG
jgi:DNA helicase-2/ATP-dependent DNA helicase PcrA